MSVPVSAAPELLDFLATGDDDEKEVSIGLLAELVASAYGKDGVVLGEIVRDLEIELHQHRLPAATTTVAATRWATTTNTQRDCAT